MNENKLAVIDGETLMDMRLPKRSNGLRMIKIFFSSVNSDASAVSDANTGCAKTCVPCDPVEGVNAPRRR